MDARQNADVPAPSARHPTQGAANLLFEKGFDNVFLLSGGLRELASACPQILEGAHTCGRVVLKEEWTSAQAGARN